ncbi:MAG TPA: aminotransferase class V-fold PLP-dependent enzyme [Allosphingosinicella sp.]
MSQPRIYLDHAATTPILPAAKAAMMEAMERWANPSSPHAEGRAARAALEDARGRIKRALGWDGELIFTSGASEAIEIAMKRSRRARRIISPVEHDAVLRAAPDAELLPMADYWQEPEVLAGALTSGPPGIVAIQHVNSETGVVMLPSLGRKSPILAQIHDAGSILMCDCSQSTFVRSVAGHDPMNLLPEADLYVLSAHKMGGPPGIGALLVRDLSLLEAAGGQEFGYRGGTENLPAAVGFAAALEAVIEQPWTDQLADAVLEFKDFVWGQGAHVPDRGGAYTDRIKAIAMPGLSARAQLIKFDQLGFAVSAGSACSSGSLKPSRVLKAFGVPDEVAERTIRVSFGWTTTAEDIRAFEQAWLRIADEARSRAA